MRWQEIVTYRPVSNEHRNSLYNSRLIMANLRREHTTKVSSGCTYYFYIVNLQDGRWRFTFSCNAFADFNTNYKRLYTREATNRL